MHLTDLSATQEHTNTTMTSIQQGNIAAGLTEAHSKINGIADTFVPWANMYYAMSPPFGPSRWGPLPEGYTGEAKGWLNALNIWPQGRPLPYGVLWRTTGHWNRGAWPPPSGEELGLVMTPLREWLAAVPNAPANPVSRYVINFASRMVKDGNVYIIPHFFNQLTGRQEPRLPVFAAGLNERNRVCLAEQPDDALALNAHGYRAVAIGNYAAKSKQGSTGKFVLTETLKLLASLSNEVIDVYRGPNTRQEGVERIARELETQHQAQVAVKTIPENWPPFTK